MPDEQDREQIQLSWSSPDTWARLLANFGLPTIILGAACWYLLPPLADMVRAVNIAIPIHAEAAKESAEASRVTATALEQIGKANSRVADSQEAIAKAVENQTAAVRNQTELMRELFKQPQPPGGSE